MHPSSHPPIHPSIHPSIHLSIPTGWVGTCSTKDDLYQRFSDFVMLDPPKECVILRNFSRLYGDHRNLTVCITSKL
jgi:hypothetical protein